MEIAGRKMRMKKISFFKLLSVWFGIAVVLLLANSFSLKNSVVHSIILASLGFVLLIYPVYPDTLGDKYDNKKCRLIVRTIAVIEIILSFLVQTAF